MTAKPTRAFLWASGYIELTDDAVPVGTILLMTGDREELEMILYGTTAFVGENGRMLWSIETLFSRGKEVDQGYNRYILAMLWLAKAAQLYASPKVTFHVNQAGNQRIRRITAQAINKALH
jgi:hypothetical protein